MYSSQATQLILPDAFNNLIQGTKYEGALKSFLVSVTYLLDRHCVLFPEFTDHSSRHIQDVLNHAHIVMDPDAFPSLSAEDVYTLTVACCLHDFAMTFSWNDLVSLIQDERFSGQLYGFKSERTWIDLWSEFEAEFRNMDLTDIGVIVGENIINHSQFVFPDLTGNGDLAISSLKIAGEFVRRNHARIAQVIATFGFPGQTIGETLSLDFKELNQMAGFVARSHHHNMREMFDKLLGSHKRNYLGSHPMFLMAVLRIADLLQITIARTPPILYTATSFWSNKSRDEWRKHLNIQNVHWEDSDPACLTFQISSSIDDVKTLVSIREIINYLQSELDKAWASLGETFGHSASAYGLRFRRVKSDLNDVSFLSGLSFEEQPGEFEVDTSLIDKLITPLYGDRPEIGIRELVQNSLDSIRERRYLDDTATPKVRIDLEKADESYFLRVTDDGCGMDGFIIRNFFLRIGASYKASKLWRGVFSHGSQPQVLRSGRFGIGMLAAFILGDEINVKTRKFIGPGKTAEYAIQFKMKLHDKNIQLQKIFDKSIPAGTVITIEISEKKYKQLKSNPGIWDWYVNTHENYLEVERYIDGDIVNQVVDGNGPRIDLSKDIVGVDGFQWFPEKTSFVPPNMLVVNSLKIAIQSGHSTNYSCKLDSFDETEKYWTYDINWPGVALQDNNSNLPLNLSRDGFSDNNLVFAKPLYESVISFVLKKINDFSEEITFSEVDSRKFENLFSFMSTRNKASVGITSGVVISVWGAHENGFLLSDFSLLKRAGIKRLIFSSRGAKVAIDEYSVVYRILSHGSLKNEYRNYIIESSIESSVLRMAAQGTLIKHGFFVNYPINKELEVGLLMYTAHYEKILQSFNRYFGNNKNFKSNSYGRFTYISNFSADMPYHDLSSVDLGENGFLVDLKINEYEEEYPTSLLVKEWLKNMNSPFASKNTKFGGSP